LKNFSDFLAFFLEKFGHFWHFFEKILLLRAKLRLRVCLAMCLIFQENRGWRAYKRVAYKKKKVYFNIYYLIYENCTI